MNCYDEIFNTIKKLIENKEISSYQINKVLELLSSSQLFEI
nr:hypothetical protein [Staphylococcus aureus]